MTLKDTIQTLLDSSRETGTEKEVRLVRGLIICIRSNSQQTRLSLRRRDKMPSYLEWRTVMEAWPEPHTRCDPEERTINGKRVLYGVWSTPERLIEVASTPRPVRLVKE